jgi:hypothetical protein
MGKKEIIVTIDPETGKIQFETKGFTGQSCMEATKEIELALGKADSTEKTAEYYKKGDDRDAWITKMN